MSEFLDPQEQQIKQQKRLLRQQMRQRLAALPADQRASRSRAAAERLTVLPQFRQARTVMAFLSLSDEIDTRFLLDAAWGQDKIVAVPQVMWETGQMIPVIMNGWQEPLIEDRKGLRIPASQEKLSLGALDFVAVPGLAFDLAGGRLGRGGGYYDRFLQSSAFQGLACGFALEFQVVEKIPALPYDQKIAMLVTDIKETLCR